MISSVRRFRSSSSRGMNGAGSIHDFELVFAFGGEVDDVAAQALAIDAAFAKEGGQRLGNLRSLVFAGALLQRIEHVFQAFHTEKQLQRAGELFGIAR